MRSCLAAVAAVVFVLAGCETGPVTTPVTTPAPAPKPPEVPRG